MMVVLRGPAMQLTRNTQSTQHATRALFLQILNQSARRVPKSDISIVAGAGLWKYDGCVAWPCHATHMQHTRNTQSTQHATRALFLQILNERADFEGLTQNPVFKWKYQILAHDAHFD